VWPLSLLLGLLLALLPSTTVAAESLGAIRRLLDDPDPAARAAAVRRLAGTDDAAAQRLVLDVLGDAHPYVRRAAGGVLAGVVERRHALASAVARLRSPEARAAACEGLALWLDDEGARALAALAGDRDPGVRAAALDALVGPLRAGTADLALPPGLRADVVGPRLVETLTDRDGLVRAVALEHLRLWRPDLLTAEQWVAFLSDADPRVRLAALEGSAATSGAAAVFAVLLGSKDAVWSIRLVAAELAGAVRDRRVLERLVAWREEEPRRRLVTALEVALVRLTGIPFEGAQWRTWLEGDGRAFDPAEVPAPPAAAFDGGTHTVETVDFLGVPLVSAHVAFVLDGSSSMREVGADGRRRDERAQAALAAALDGLAARDRTVRFNVHRFHDGVESLADEALALTAATRERALRWLAARPPGGRTALYDGIAAGLADPEVDQVIVLSDGAPSAGSWFTKTDLLAEVARANRWRHARIDVVSLGSERVAARWRDLLTRLARAHGGLSLSR
jgi:HEAT repeat protein